MWDEAQALYIEEVLGLSVEHLRGLRPASQKTSSITTAANATSAQPVNSAATSPVGVQTKVHAVILSPLPNETERALLAKILASINISDLEVYSVLPVDLEVAHVLAFNGSSGVNQSGACTHWGLPRLAQMCGGGPEVNAHKRETWAQLQKFRDAYNAIAR